jgi:hypothetical protein
VAPFRPSRWLGVTPMVPKCVTEADAPGLTKSEGDPHSRGKVCKELL